jgi:hypothetical protein
MTIRALRWPFGWVVSGKNGFPCVKRHWIK